MTLNHIISGLKNGHRIILFVVLCLFGLCAVSSQRPVGDKKPATKGQQTKKRKTSTPKDTTTYENNRVYLLHSDELSFDRYRNPDAQILNGNVAFRHQGATLYCDSAHFYEKSNSFEAFRNVRMYQGDTLSLFCDYAYYDGFDYYCFKRRIYTPDNDATSDYTKNADKVFLYLENAYYGGDKGGIDTTSYLKDGFTYASYGLAIVGKLGTYDQYILDSDFNVVMSLSGNYGVTIKDQKKEKVGYFDLVMQSVDGYYYNPLQPSEVNVYDKDGKLVGHNDRATVVQQELSNNMIVAAITDPDDSKSYLFGAFNLYGETVIPFEYSSLSAFRGSYTIGMKYDSDARKTLPYIIGSDGKVVTEMSDGTAPLADIAKSTTSQYIYKIGCYMNYVTTTGADGKEVKLFGIKNFNPNVNKNVIMPATMASGSVLYASSKCPNKVFVFEKVTSGSAVAYTVYQLI